MQKSRIIGVLLLIAMQGIFTAENNQNSTYTPFKAQSLSFSDVTSDTLKDATRNLGPHGIYWADADNNGYPDLYVTRYNRHGDTTDVLFINQGGLDFRARQDQLGVRDLDGGSHGACWADLDNDGDYDLINGSTVLTKSVSVWEGAPNNVYQNTGSGFTDSTPAAMLNRVTWTRGIIAFDRESDGDLDIFAVSGYLGWTGDDDGFPSNEYFKNEGGWTFSEILTGDAVNARCGQGVTAADFDNDGDIDLFVGNRTGYAYLLRNNGLGVFDTLSPSLHGIYVNNASDIGIAGEGVTLGDLDNDGDLDLIAIETANPDIGSHSEAAHVFYNNTYNPVPGREHLLFVYKDNRYSFYNVDGYMAALGDLNHDGWLDMVISGASRPFMNNGSGDLAENYTIQIPYGDEMEDPRGMAFADIDLDGDLDFAVAGKYEGTVNPLISRVFLFQNNLSSSNHWLKVKLVSPEGQAGAFGAKLYVAPGDQGGIYGKRGGGLPQIGLREARGNNGYLGQDEPVLHFGLASATEVDVVVEYVGGRSATRTNVAADQMITIDRADIRVASKVYLEGPYSGGSMNTALKTSGAISLTSPYPEDPRTVTAVPANAVDWVLVELRSGAGSETVVAQKSAFVRNDGMIIADDGIAEYITMNAEIGSYYLVIKHRNHLPIMSQEKIAFSDI